MAAVGVAEIARPPMLPLRVAAPDGLIKVAVPEPHEDPDGLTELVKY
jgi:hypothetical protein